MTPRPWYFTKRQWRRLIVRSILMAKLTAVIDAALFYLFFDLIGHVKVSWLIVFVVAWCADTALGPRVREDAIKKAEADKLLLFEKKS